MRSSLIFLMAALCVIVTDADQCQAQLFGPRRAHKTRPTLTRQAWGQSAGSVRPQVSQNSGTVFPIEDYFTPRLPKIARILDGPMNYQYRNPLEVDSRYIGGFHQSHFYNIGIPSGDIGIRGNAYNWNTW